MAIVLLLALILMGVGAARARAAVQDAQRNASAAQIRVLSSTINAYGLDHSGYGGMTPALLARDYGFRAESATSQTLTITGTGVDSYCIQVRDGGWYAGQRGPLGLVETSQSPIC